MAEDKKEIEVSSSPTVEPHKKVVYSLMWRTYDLTGKTKSQFVKGHPYSVNPVKALSNKFIARL